MDGWDRTQCAAGAGHADTREQAHLERLEAVCPRRAHSSPRLITPSVCVGSIGWAFGAPGLPRAP